MNVFKNKHIVVALIVAPILAILSYFAVDQMVSEKPHEAIEGASYPLVELPNCRYSSGECSLKNGEFKIDFTLEESSNQMALLTLKSKFSLQGARIALVESGQDSHPLSMYQQGALGQQWELEIQRPNPETDRLHVVVAANDSIYFGDIATSFSVYQTIFEKDFRASE